MNSKVCPVYTIDNGTWNMFPETLALLNNVPRLGHLSLDCSELWTSVGFTVVEAKFQIYKLLEPCMYFGEV